GQVAPLAGEQASEREPVLLRDLAPGDQDEAREARFGGEQVVAPRVPAAGGDVVADREQLARAVVEEVEVHLAERAASRRKRFDPRGPRLRRLPIRGVVQKVPALLEQRVR